MNTLHNKIYLPLTLAITKEALIAMVIGIAISVTFLTFLTRYLTTPLTF